MCGGTLSILAILVAKSGLSPRVRGNPADAGDRHGKRRSIPACAGEPGLCVVGVVGERVYPRVCGGTQYFNW